MKPTNSRPNQKSQSEVQIDSSSRMIRPEATEDAAMAGRRAGTPENLPAFLRPGQAERPAAVGPDERVQRPVAHREADVLHRLEAAEALRDPVRRQRRHRPPGAADDPARGDRGRRHGRPARRHPGEPAGRPVAHREADVLHRLEAAEALRDPVRRQDGAVDRRVLRMIRPEATEDAAMAGRRAGTPENLPAFLRPGPDEAVGREQDEADEQQAEPKKPVGGPDRQQLAEQDESPGSPAC
jgi:hypothetical protein